MFEQCVNNGKRQQRALWEIAAQFVRDAVSGGIATLADWGVCYAVLNRAGLHYQLATVCSFSAGALINYTLSKLFVFRCTSRRIAEQLGVYACITGVALLGTMGMMYVLVRLIGVPAMPSRMLTTGIMVLANYGLHKVITFNPRWFTPHGN